MFISFQRIVTHIRLVGVFQSTASRRRRRGCCTIIQFSECDFVIPWKTAEELWTSTGNLIFLVILQEINHHCKETFVVVCFFFWSSSRWKQKKSSKRACAEIPKKFKLNLLFPCYIDTKQSPTCESKHVPYHKHRNPTYNGGWGEYSIWSGLS